MEYNGIYSKAFSDVRYNSHVDSEPRFEYVRKFLMGGDVNTIGDFGSGRGNVISVVQRHYDHINIESYDLEKFHNYDVPFSNINLCDNQSIENINKIYDLVTCLDVMEHLQKECVDDVLSFFCRISKYCILTIANHSDVKNGVELHLIQEDLTYWLPLIEQYFDVIHRASEYDGRLYLLTLKSKK